MSDTNDAPNENHRRIVVYGPMGAGKTTCLKCLGHLETSPRGKPQAYKPPSERTTELDFIAEDVPARGGKKTRVHLATVSGWAFPHVDRRLLVKGASGILFVADSRPDKAADNVASMKELLENLRAQDIDPEGCPIVLVFNKRDVRGAASASEMNAALNGPDGAALVPRSHFEATAARRLGVAEAFDALLRLALDIPDPITWESTGDAGIPYRALASNKRLYVKQGAEGEPLYTLIVDGAPTETHDEWPPHWLLPRVRISDPTLPVLSPPVPVRDVSSPPVPVPVPVPVLSSPAPPSPLTLPKQLPLTAPNPMDFSAPLPPELPERAFTQRIFTVWANVRYKCGAPVTIMLVAAVIDGEDGAEPNLVGAGMAKQAFSMSFTREAFASRPGVPLPNVHIVFSVMNAREDDLVPVFRYDIEPSRLLAGNLGTIVLPMKKGDPLKPLPGVPRVPGARVVRKRLRLDAELVQTSSLLVSSFLAEHTQFPDLLAGIRFEVVDDFVAPIRTRVETLLGRTTFDDRESAIIEHAGRSFSTALGFWDPLHSVVYLNRVELEQQNLGFLWCTIGHELVHVGQSKQCPELDAEWRALARELWTLRIADKNPPRALFETVFGVMANLEGYADYIERSILMSAFTCSMQLESAAVAPVGELEAPPRAHTELDATQEADAPLSMRSAYMTNKSAQYDSGRRAYLKRAKLTTKMAAPFDPTLKPDPLLPEDILKPLMARALAGDAYSQMSLGDVYRTGGMVGVVADRIKASRWYRLAAAGGSAEAAARLRAMETEARGDRS